MQVWEPFAPVGVARNPWRAQVERDSPKQEAVPTDSPVSLGKGRICLDANIFAPSLLIKHEAEVGGGKPWYTEILVIC